jgi:hypothetical protein
MIIWQNVIRTIYCVLQFFVHYTTQPKACEFTAYIIANSLSSDKQNNN